jgi:hypothetical protein
MTLVDDNAAAKPPASAAHRTFLIVLGLFTVAWVLVPYFVSWSPTLTCKRTQNPWVALNCAKALPAVVRTLPDADVVLVGDSSLAVGVKAEKMSRDLGAGTFNLGLSAPVFYNDGPYVLREYLASHAAPRAIVFYLAPSNLSVAHEVSEEWGEAATYDLSAHRWRRLLGIYRPHWQRIIEYSVGVLKTAAMTFDPSGRYWRLAEPRLSTDRGWLDLTIRRPVEAMTECAPEDVSGPVMLPDTAMIQQWRHEFESAKTRVLVYVAPLPNCDSTLAAYRRNYSGLTDNTEQALPVEDFIDDRIQIHPTVEGADRATDLLTAVVRPALRASER